ncbi:hypothetical protein NKH77_23995 [Streptomyces sp. M19]
MLARLTWGPPYGEVSVAAPTRPSAGCWRAGCCCRPAPATWCCRARSRCTCAAGAPTARPSRCRRC